jgi:hypothetical protein
LQAIIGSVMGIGYMARNQIRALVAKFKRTLPADKPDHK